MDTILQHSGNEPAATPAPWAWSATASMTRPC